MRRKVDFTRIYFPLTLALILFATFLPFRTKPIDVPGFGDMHAYLEFAAYGALIFLLVRAIDTLVFDVVLRRQVAAPQILRGLVSIVLYIILFASAFSTIFNYDFRALLTGGAVLAAVLGLALQDTLGNLFSGIAMHTEETYEIGDVVHTGEHTGVVEGISWRATRIRGFNNQMVVVPNSVMARDRLEIFPHHNLNGRVISVGIDYNAAPATVIGILTQVAAHVEGVARERPCFARVASFGDSAVIYEIKYFTRDYSARERIDADIRKAVWYALRRNGISIPFPIRSFQPYSPASGEHQVTPEEVFQRLRAVDVLQPISDQALQSVAAAVNLHFYSKGEAILRYGTAGDSMFVVHTGSVAVRVPDDSLTGWHQVAELGPGTVFGEMALLTGEMRTADVVAMTDVVALEIGKESLHPIMAVHPDLAGAISHQIMLRREHLESLKSVDREQEELTLMSRIRSYFGL